MSLDTKETFQPGKVIEVELNRDSLILIYLPIHRDHECEFDRTDMMTFYVMLCIGCIYTVLSGLVSFYLKKISAKIIVRK